MSGCPDGGKDFCTKAECAKLRAEIKELKSDIQRVRNEINRHAKQCISASGGAHRWCGAVPLGRSGKPGKNGKDGKPGKQGKQGKQGKPGKDGKTPVKGRDYFDGSPGRDGRNGSDGRDGRDGRNGRDGRDGRDGREIIVRPPAPIIIYRPVPIPRPPAPITKPPVTVVVKPTFNINTIIPVIVGIVYARLEANLNVILAPKITLAVKNELNIVLAPRINLTVKNEFALQINTIIALIYAKLEATLKVEINNQINVKLPTIEANLYIKLIAQLNVEINNQINVKLPSIEANLYAKLLIQLNLKIINEINLKMPNLNIDFSPVLNVLVRMQNQLNIQQNNQLNIQAQLNIQKNNLLNIQNTLNLNVTNELTTIKDKVSINSTILKDTCTMPELTDPDKPMPKDITPYIHDSSSIGVTDFSGAISGLSNQLSDVFKEVCSLKKVTNLIEIECCDDSCSEEEIAKGYRTIYNTPTSPEAGMMIFQRQINRLTQQLLCEKNDLSCSVLLPDPRAVWNTDGYYIFFHWKLENPQTKAEKTWKNVTQLAEPIDEILTPADPSAVWDEYFAGIYQVLGNQWGQYRSKNKARRYPLYKGWFADKGEARRFFASIKNLTKIEGDPKNNPSFSEKDNQSVELVNQGKKIVLRKVCVGYKVPDSNDVKILRGYQAKS